MISRLINTEQKMLSLGADFAKVIHPGICVALNGDLGAGKTTLVRGLLRGFGYQGTVKSPTYTLVETYSFTDFKLHHFDFYRLIDPEELEFMGIRDYFNGNDICFIEWPERGKEYLPAVDLSCYIHIQDDKRLVEIKANTTLGQSIVKG